MRQSTPLFIGRVKQLVPVQHLFRASHTIHERSYLAWVHPDLPELKEFMNQLFYGRMSCQVKQPDERWSVTSSLGLRLNGLSGKGMRPLSSIRLMSSARTRRRLRNRL